MRYGLDLKRQIASAATVDINLRSSSRARADGGGALVDHP